jgi:hypothetical protein
MTASIVSRIAESASIPKEFPVEFPAAGKSMIMADPFLSYVRVSLRIIPA